MKGKVMKKKVPMTRIAQASSSNDINKHDEKQNLLNNDMDSGSQNTSGI